MTIEKRLKQLGIELPDAKKPMYSYQSVTLVGNTAYISGQIARVNAEILYKGKVGSDVTVEQAQECASKCVLQALSQLTDTLGSLDKVQKVVKITGFVNAIPTFTEHSVVLDAASNLLMEIFGENGRHSRSALGAGSLPQMAPIEIEFIFEVLG
jgi:enamine deaminase RidA (YjgF/YER057c/UK114 family)